MAVLMQNARKIWTKDVWKRAILRTDVGLPPTKFIRSYTKNHPILGDLSMQSLLYTERKSHVAVKTVTRVLVWIICSNVGL